MEIKINRKDILSSYGAQILNYGASLFLLPIVLSKLSGDELAIWYIFIAISSFSFLLDFGFQPNISRSISYIFSGASSLTAEGTGSITLGNGINYGLLKTTLKVIRKIYSSLALLMCFLMATIGSVYMYNTIPPQINNIWWAWGIYIISCNISFYYTYYNSLLTGSGKIAQSNMIIIISKLTYVILAIILIRLNLGLLGIAIANLVATIVNRICIHFTFFSRNLIELLKETKEIFSATEVFSAIWRNSKKTGLISIAVFGMTQANILIAGQFFEFSMVAQLGLIMQLFTMLQAVSRLYFNTYMPRFSSLRIIQDKIELRRNFIKSMRIGWGIYILGFIIIMFLGNYILLLISSKTLLPTKPIIFAFGLMYLMEITHGNCALFITTKNTVPFLGASLYTSVGIILLSLMFVSKLELGLMSFPLATIICQLFYNAWKWPYEVIKDLKLIR